MNQTSLQISKQDLVFPQRALVTGASGGIGRAIALKLAKNGYDVIANYYQNLLEAEALKNEIEQLKGTCTILHFDVADLQGMKAALEPIFKSGYPSVLVHNAGYLETGPVGLLEEGGIRKVMDVNLTSFFFLLKMIVRDMMRRRHGSIITVSSLAGCVGFSGQVLYSASKSGLIGATFALAKELGPYGIRVNSVVPGLIDTKMSEKFKEIVTGEIPLKRAGKPEEVAEVVAFLCSKSASYISGAAIPVTGGIPI